MNELSKQIMTYALILGITAYANLSLTKLQKAQTTETLQWFEDGRYITRKPANCLPIPRFQNIKLEDIKFEPMKKGLRQINEGFS